MVGKIKKISEPTLDAMKKGMNMVLALTVPVRPICTLLIYTNKTYDTFAFEQRQQPDLKLETSDNPPLPPLH